MESIAFSLFCFPVDKNDKMIERMKENIFTKYNLVFNGKIIEESEDLSEIENLNEIIVVKKDSNKNKK